MTLEERLKASNKNINPSQYSGNTKFNLDRSKLNVDKIPSKYNTAGKIASLKDLSKFNVDGKPSKYAPK